MKSPKPCISPLPTSLHLPTNLKAKSPMHGKTISPFVNTSPATNHLFLGRQHTIFTKNTQSVRFPPFPSHRYDAIMTSLF